MATTWNPADVSTNVTLSNTNHTATTAAGAGNEGGRSTTSKTATGKYYVELTGITTVNAAGFGLGSGAEAINTNGVPAFRLTETGGVTTPSGSSFAGLGSAPDGKTVAMAFDFNASPPRAWIRYDAGAWFGPSGTGADPTNPATGYDLTSLVFPTFLKFFLQFSGHTVTLNAGDSAFLQAMPTGFVAWGAAGTSARALFIGA